jgi:serine/threonine-protein kinase RsbT
VTPTSERVLGVLRRFTSESTARLLLLRACFEHELSPHDLTVPQLHRILPRLTSGARTTIGPRRSETLAQALELITEDIPDGPTELNVRDEHDARRARLIARSLCDRAGAARLVGLKVATGLSELTRNLLNYAGGGTVTIWILADPTRARVEVVDHGPGIADVELVLSGRYRSRTGLGRGLLGTKKMADHFELRTGADGTHVIFEMRL